MMKEYHFSARQLAIILIIIAIALFLVVLSSAFELIKAASIECAELHGHSANETCPFVRNINIPLQSYAGFTISFILAAIGIFIVLSSRKYREELTEKEKQMARTIQTLTGDEKKVFEAIKNNEGSILQSDLIEKTGLSKVKISRILDRLEGRGIVERKRRGMSNVVLAR